MSERRGYPRAFWRIFGTVRTGSTSGTHRVIINNYTELAPAP